MAAITSSLGGIVGRLIDWSKKLISIEEEGGDESLVQTIADLRERVNKISKKTLPAVFFSKDKNGKLFLEKSIYPEPCKFSLNEMRVLVNKVQKQVKVIDCLRNLNPLKELLVNLKKNNSRSQKLTGILINHHNEAHWDGLLVKGNHVYIPTIVTSKNSPFFKKIKQVCEELGLTVFKGPQLQANNFSCGPIALKCVSYFVGLGRVPDTLKNKIVLPPQLLVFAELSKTWSEGRASWKKLHHKEFTFKRPQSEYFVHGASCFEKERQKIALDFDKIKKSAKTGKDKDVFNPTLKTAYLAQYWLSELYKGFLDKKA